MRVLRALFNFAAGRYEDSQGRALITENPVRRLSQTRAWYRVERRQSFIKSHELARWYTAVQEIENQTLHDLRRTFITVAESLDIPAYALKRLLNHKMNGDVTAGYIMRDVERLRKPMQAITNYLLQQMEAAPSLNREF